MDVAKVTPEAQDGYDLYDFEGDFVEYAHNVTGVERIASALKACDIKEVDALTLHLNQAARDWLAADADDTDGQDAIVRQAFQEIVKVLE